MSKIIESRFIKDNRYYLKYSDGSSEEVTKEEYYVNKIGSSKLTLSYGTYTSYGKVT